ncbi:hypothetical protein ABMA27_011040 [Loxostege sticticalis]|uniref:KAT8 regulatory NSL complex subunit 2 n=1 Tax=Loxostege sticticalis TaxID=481309 RepID=A0ABR3H349_LOXSC
MFRFRSENYSYLNAHNIRITEFNPTIPTMSNPPRKVIHLPKVRMLSRSGRAPPAQGLRITNVKSIKPPDPGALKKQEEDKLRAQLQQEIVSRSRSCAYKGYECTLPVMSGRQYCGRHILKDPTAPYKPCAHTYSNGDRCQQPAPDQREHRDQGLCFEHARASLHARQRSAAPPPPATTTETLLHQLQHYVRPERPRTTSCASSVSVVSDHDQQDQGVPSAVDPFKQIDATAVNAQYSASIMECASASDSDCDSVTLGPEGTVRECDSESDEAPSAYTRQLGRLRVLLQAHRSQYLKALKAEKETYCSINSQARSGPLTVRERRQLRKLKAYAAHHRKHGVDALLARKLHHKRAKQGTEHSNRPIPSQGRCTFMEESVRCGNPVLPASKHCLKHILHDRHQVLFTACGDVRGVVACREPCAKLPVATPACRYHTAPPPYTPFTLKKDDSGSDSDSESTSDASEVDAPRTPAPAVPESDRSAITAAALQDVMYQ